METSIFDAVVKRLHRSGVRTEPGLSDTEVVSVERRCGFRFPPDLHEFLQHALPLGDRKPSRGEIIVGDGFPDWRNVQDDYIPQRFEGILDGIFFDIERNGFWNPDWGQKPVRLEDACEIARRELSTAPTLIPIYAHRFIPNEPLDAGNPVFSIHQTDIIYYGHDLRDYFTHEFGVPRKRRTPIRPRTIRVWTESLEWYMEEYTPFRET